MGWRAEWLVRFGGSGEERKRRDPSASYTGSQQRQSATRRGLVASREGPGHRDVIKTKIRNSWQNDTYARQGASYKINITAKKEN